MWIAEFVSKVKTRYMEELVVPAIIAVDAIAKKKKTIIITKQKFLPAQLPQEKHLINSCHQC